MTTTHLATAHNTLILIVAKRTFVANANQSSRPYVAIAYRTLSIAFVAESSDSYSGLFATHYEISVDSSVSSLLKEVLE